MNKDGEMPENLSVVSPELQIEILAMGQRIIKLEKAIDKAIDIMRDDSKDQSEARYILEKAIPE